MAPELRSDSEGEPRATVQASTGAGAPEPGATGKARTAALSVISNSALILLKVVAGTLTGSVAILTEAVHSSIDLVASMVALFSVRKAGEPADETHRYGHEKIENLSAAIEGILILVGSSAIAFEAIRHLVSSGRVRIVGLGIAVAAVSMVVNVRVSAVIAGKARLTDSPALAADAAHLRTDALTSGAVLIGLVLVSLTGQQWIDPAVALAIAGAIVLTGVRLLARSGRVLVDEALPADEVAAVRRAVEELGPRGVVGYHELRTRRAGSRRYVDLHLQFRAGTSLEDAHRIAHELEDTIGARLHEVDVLIHLEPQDRVRPGQEIKAAREGADAGAPVRRAAETPGAAGPPATSG